jgi:hypothetical protein
VPDPLMKEKIDLSSLAHELLAKTKAGKLKWLQSLPNGFTTAFGGRYHATIVRFPGIKDQKPEIRLVMRDDADDFTIGEGDNKMENPEALRELFDAVRESVIRPEFRIQDAVETLRNL